MLANTNFHNSSLAVTLVIFLAFLALPSESSSPSSEFNSQIQLLQTVKDELDSKKIHLSQKVDKDTLKLETKLHIFGLIHIFT